MSESFGMLPPAPMTEVEYAEYLEHERLAREWFAPIRAQLEKILLESNDPTQWMCDAHAYIGIASGNFATAEVVDYIAQKTDFLFECFDSSIPHVPDIAAILITDTAYLVFENGNEKLHEEIKTRLFQERFKMCDLFFTSASLHEADFGLRLSVIGRLYHFGSSLMFEVADEAALVEEGTSEHKKLVDKFFAAGSIGVFAHKAALELLQDTTPIDTKTKLVTSQFFDIEYLHKILSTFEKREDVDAAARGVSAKFGVPFDMRLVRNHHRTEEEKTGRHYSHIRQWIATVIELEAHARGTCAELYKRFGIRNFHHYPLAILKDQYDKRDLQVPYGVAVFARYDWNDVLFSYYETFLTETEFQKMCSELYTGGMHVRIIETDGKRDIAKRFAGLDRTYGTHNKVSIVYMNAHGGEEVMQLGNEHGQTLTKKDLLKLREGHLASYFVPGAEILVNSCYAGNTGGIAEAGAKVTGARVQAPTDVFNGYEKIEVAFEGEVPRFSVTPHKKEQEIAVYGV